MPNDHERTQRLAALRALLGQEPIASQGEIVRALGRRGFATTQSAVSRDLRELGAGKVAGRYRLPDDGGGTVVQVLGEVLRDFVTGYAVAGPHLLVVRTLVGGAQPVAVALDRAGWAGVVGTVAGDDTVFIACADAAAQHEIGRRLRRLETAAAGENQR